MGPVHGTSAKQEETIELGPGDHLCCIYRDAAEQMGIVVPYLICGLNNHERCLYIIEESTKNDIEKVFSKSDVDLGDYIKAGQFIFLTKEEAYLKGGSFDPDRMIATLKQAEQLALEEGYAGLRVTGEMTWIFTQLPGVERLIEYEAKLNYFFPGSRSTAICQYHESRFDPDILIDVLHTHPKVAIYGSVCENPYFIPPEEFLLRMQQSKIPLAIYQRARDDVIARAESDRERKRVEAELRKTLDNAERSRLAMLSTLEDWKSSEAALRETEERYRSLFDRSLEAIYVSDLNGIFIDANPYALKLLGYEKEEITSLNISSIVDKESVGIVYKTLEEILSTGSQVTGSVYKLRKKDGTYAWIENDAFLLYKDGKPVGIQGVARDITERKMAEEALRESEKKYRLLAENASDVITVIDTNMRPIYMSPSITRLLGYSVEESMARVIESSLTPESIKVAAESFAKGMTEERKGEKLKPVTIDLEFIRKDGSTVWVAASVALIRGSEGQPAEILSILHDITERKQAREDLIKYKDHLEELVKERTAELGKAKIIAEEANKTKSEFLANMSHEIRTPLSSIIGFSELLYDETSGPLNDKQKKYLDYVALSGQHLLSLINDILDLSKVEAGKMELLPTSFSISDLLKKSFSFIIEKALKHNIRLISDISADVDMIEADERKVKQIIYNLLSNAVKFTPDGGFITIGADIVYPNSALPVKIRKGLPDTKYVLISVKDTGIGIAKKDQSKLFTEFHQIEEPYSKKYEGTGLGLALSKNLVILHGGKIWVESKGKGKGCTFYFILPLKVLPKA